MAAGRSYAPAARTSAPASITAARPPRLTRSTRPGSTPQTSTAELTVAPGTTVTWLNGDDIPHTVVATNKAFRSRALDTEDTFSFTFTSAGEFDYFCSLHPHMTGRILVKAMTG